MGFDGIDKAKKEIFSRFRPLTPKEAAERFFDGRRTDELISIFRLYACSDGDERTLSELEYERAISSPEFLEIAAEEKEGPYKRKNQSELESIFKRMECERNLGNPRRKW